MKLGMPDLSSLRGRAAKGETSGAAIPGPLKDLYRDLRDRRLLPFVALLIVAIVAVPILLGAESKPKGGARVTSPVAVLREAAERAKASTISVVQADPGLRDYRKRLRSRRVRNPFNQHYTKSVLKGAKLNEPKSTSTTGEGKTSTSKTPEGGSSGQGGGSQGGGSQGGGGGGSQGGGGAANPSTGTVYVPAIDVTIVRSSGSKADGDKKRGKPQQRTRVLPTTSLPSRKAEVVNFIGVSPETGRSVFVVSTDVTAVFGEGRCISGSDRCQLIELDKGFPETFVRGEGGDRYKVKVTDVHVVAVDGKARKSP
jgi:hypothetical protein